MGLQLVALLLAAAHVPLSARFPQPVETQATAEMAAMQIMAAALLFPALLKDWNQCAFAAISVWPMLRIAGLMGGESDAHIYATAAYVTGWLVTLALWRSILPTEASRMLAVAIASLWALGGPILLYLRAEYGGITVWPGEANDPIWSAAGGPAWAALARLWGHHVMFASDWPLAALLVAGFFLAANKSLRSPHASDNLSP
jgi:hypothetical protein